MMNGDQYIFPKVHGRMIKYSKCLNRPESSARSSYSKLKYSTSFNPQNSNSAKLELKKPEKLVLLEPKHEILELNLSLIHV